MKRKICLLIAGLALTLTACGDYSPEETASEPTGTILASTETASVPTETVSLPETETSPEPVWSFDQTASIKECLLFEGSGLQIFSQSLTYEEDQALLNLHMNNTGDRDFYLSPSETCSPMISVNGRYLPLGTEPWAIYAGESLDFALPLPYDLMLRYGISRIGEIKFCLTEQDFSTGILTLSADPEYDSFWQKITRDTDSLDAQILHTSESSAFSGAGVSHCGTALLSQSDGSLLLCLDFQNTAADIRVLHMSGETLNGLQLLSQGDMITLLPGGHGQLLLDLSQWEAQNHLKELGIQKPGTVSFDLSVFSSQMEPLLKAVTAVIPIEETVPSFTFSGAEVLTEENIHIAFPGIYPRDDGGWDLLLIADNHTGGSFMFQADSLCSGETEIPAARSSVHMTGNGLALLAIPLEAKPQGSLTLKGQLRSSSVSGRVSLSLPEQN